MLSCDKAAGVDEIVNEVFCRHELSDYILEILNICYASKTVPNEWYISLLVPVFKKGNPSTYAKLYNRLLLGRIRDGLDNHLRQNMNGFFLFAPLVNKSLRGAEYMKRLSPLLRTPAWYPSLSTSPKPSTRWTGDISYDVPIGTVDAVMSVYYYGASAAVKFDEVSLNSLTY